MSLLDVERLRASLSRAEPLPVRGRVLRASGVLIEATLPRVAVGTCCEIHTGPGESLPAEVVGFNGPSALLVPLGEMRGVCEGAPVLPQSGSLMLAAGPALLGRVLDVLLRPVDGGPRPLLPDRIPLHAPPPPAMSRRRIARAIPLGLRAVDTFLTLGEGQRVGIFAGAGVGKSVLLGMLARNASADVVVVGLIGERGREVREFVERDLGPKGLARSVVVVATSDEPPLVRIRAAMAATAVAEHFRARGQKVLLLLDSLTRVAMAQREIGLAAGEPPTSKGYPPSVFTFLPRLIERAGNDEGGGSITALYTVLVEGDDLADPVADSARSLLDGHIVLSRKLAEAGHFPAVDVLGSVSRVFTDVTAKAHRELAREGRDVLSAYREAADLVEVGAYSAGSNPRVDRALRCIGPLQTFLRQGPEESSSLDGALAQLRQVLATGGEVRRG